MCRLVPARQDQIRQITGESYALWGGGLTHDAYVAMWAELERTPWARLHYTHYAWMDGDGHLLSSVKVYSPLMRLFERTGRATAIGAVFTPRTRRGRGHAAAMIRAVVEEGRSRGDLLVLLFSDIGTRYYGRLGFAALPAEEATGTLGPRSARMSEGISLRPMVPGDHEAVVEAHAEAGRGRALSVVRDLEHWSFVVSRARAFFSRLDGTDLSDVYRTATRNGRFLGYLVGLRGGDCWNVREASAAGGDPELLAAILRAGAAEARAGGARHVYGWVPREFADLVPEWRLRFSPRERAIPMILPLGGEVSPSPLRSASAAYLSPVDHF